MLGCHLQDIVKHLRFSSPACITNSDSYISVQFFVKTISLHPSKVDQQRNRIVFSHLFVEHIISFGPHFSCVCSFSGMLDLGCYQHLILAWIGPFSLITYGVVKIGLNSQGHNYTFNFLYYILESYSHFDFAI